MMALCVGTIRAALLSQAEKIAVRRKLLLRQLKEDLLLPPHSVFLAARLSPSFRKIAFSQSTDCLLHLRVNTGGLEY